MSGVARPLKGLGAALLVALVVGTLTGCPGTTERTAAIYLTNGTMDNIKVYIVDKEDGDHVNKGERILIDACWEDCIGLTALVPVHRSYGQVALLRFEIIRNPFTSGSFSYRAEFTLQEPEHGQFVLVATNDGAKDWVLHQVLDTW